MNLISFGKKASRPIIISLGGSIFSRSDGLAVDYLKAFSEIIRGEVRLGKRFVIVTGGGALCRSYQHAARDIAKISHDDLDWIGIASTRLNAQLARSILADIAHPDIIENPTKPPKATMPVIIGSGWIPGRSSDHDAVLLAKHYGASEIINLGSARFVYSADPAKNTDAQKFTDITWAKYREIIPKEWTPGMSAPFDPMASKEAMEAGISVVIMDGHELDAFKNLLLTGKNETGTIIHP